MNTEMTAEHGFKMLALAHDLKIQFHAEGQEGFVSFAKACIAFGMHHPEDIIAEACAIGGDHLEGEFDTILMEGENIHWIKSNGGKLYHNHQ